MIFVSRGDVAAPAGLASNRAQRAVKVASQFYERPLEERPQEMHEFDDRVYTAPEVEEALRRLFHDKCAFCESPPGLNQRPVVHHFRPTAWAVDLDGGVAQDHYWWLAYVWENLYWACPDCSRRKGARFPVERARAAPETALESEQPLLLDPSTIDPELHLVFQDDGNVTSGTRAGMVTITTLALNRWWLVMARHEALGRLRQEWDEHAATVRAGDAAAVAALDQITAASHPYAGMRRQFIRRWIAEGPVPNALIPNTGKGPEEGKVSLVTGVQSEATQEVFDDFRAETLNYSLAAEESESYYIAMRTIRRVEIENFRLIDKLALDIGEDVGSSTMPWLMLLGENGVGKTSALQAIALALMGDEYRLRIGLDARSILRHRAPAGCVRVFVTGSADPIELHFRRGSRKLEASDPQPKLLLLGYGATRLLPRGGVEPRATASFAHVDNLFSPFSPIEDPTEWLLELDDFTFDTVARALNGIVPTGADGRFVRSRGRLRVKARGASLNLRELSDGWQAVIAMAADIIHVLMHRWEAMEVAEGIVLIDELDAHLHPRWAMRIVAELRAVFPRVQFLATTHSPLCLRGLREGERVVMREAEDGVVADDELPSLSGLRVDQLLTSEIFGLETTVDPELDAAFKRYLALRRRKRLRADERSEFQQLRARLDDARLLGADRRQRLIADAAVEYLATEPKGAPRRELRAQTRKRIGELFAMAVPPEDSR